MPIEFQCNRCSRLLRVPDGSHGKPCNCPGCKERLIIPSPVEIVPVVEEEVYGIRIEVPCPKCKNILQCDATLDGTRGCCPSCAHVFTISLDSDSKIPVANSDSFPFACPKCKQLFEGTPYKEGKKGKCTGCREVFVIERYHPPTPVRVEPPKPLPIPKARPAKPPTPIVSQTQRSKPIAQQPAPASNPLQDLSTLLPPPNYSRPTYVRPAATPRRPAIRNSRPSNSKQGSRVGLILGIVGGVGALMLLICCGGGGLLFWFLTQKHSISAGGYATDAPGMVAKTNNLHANLDGQLIVNPMTRSEFFIALARPVGGSRLTPEMYVQNIQSSGALALAPTPVSRAGLNGFHFQTQGNGTVPTAIGEVFGTGDTVLLLMYANGADLQKNGTRSRMNQKEAQAWDKPDNFFESLRKSQ